MVRDHASKHTDDEGDPGRGCIDAPDADHDRAALNDPARPAGRTCGTATTTASTTRPRRPASTTTPAAPQKQCALRHDPSRRHVSRQSTDSAFQLLDPRTQFAVHAPERRPPAGPQASDPCTRTGGYR